MTAVTFTKSVPAPRSPVGIDLFATLAFVAVMAIRLVAYQHHNGAIFLEDDAYYYKLIAENLAATGRSTFDGQVLTNGYHPLWLLLLTAQMALVGPNDAVTAGLEVALAAGGLWFTLVSFRNGSLLFRTAYAAFYTLLGWPMIAKGMEVSLLLFAFGLFVWVLDGYLAGRRTAVHLGLAAVLCIGARLDAAAFVLPAMVLAAGAPRPAAWAMLPVVLFGAAYALVNLAVFGIAVPVSGAVKSLGGLQVNHALLAQAALAWPEGTLTGLSAFGKSMIGRPLVCALLLLAALALAPRRRRGLILAASFFIGLAAFAGKLLFLSSWVVWAWYGFPALLALTTLFILLDGWVAVPRSRAFAAGQSIASVALVGLLAGQQYAASWTSLAAFHPVNRAAARYFSPIFDGAHVAMGDRAGSFAAAYPGPVTQLEGLVNDSTYLSALETKTDVKPLLCERGVQFVLAYHRDLGPYATVAIPVLRPQLTTYPAPELVFTREAEVGHLTGPSLSGDDASTLYAWRLDCPPS